MHTSHFALIGLAATLLSGCASLAGPQPGYAYFVVPCETPGAIRTGPAASNSEGPLPQTGPSELQDPTRAAEAKAPVCVVAARLPPAYASGRYYPSGYFDGRYYGRPFYSLGAGYYRGGHVTTHRGSGHHGGGRRGH